MALHVDEWRRLKKLSKEEMAQKLGVHRNTIIRALSRLKKLIKWQISTAWSSTILFFYHSCTHKCEQVILYDYHKRIRY